MPTIWRFLLGQYLNVLVLCVFSFIAILLTIRMDELAQFAALGATGPYVLRFIVYQIPYVLPIAIPISALISTVILMQRLSGTYELTALRACGYSLAHVAAPLLLMAALLSIGNFYIISEMATHSHLMKRMLRRDVKALNPLVLLQNEKLTRMKGIYAHAAGGLKSGEDANDLVIASYNNRSNHIDMLLAKHLTSSSSALNAEHVTFISTLRSADENAHDDLIVDNAESVILPTLDLSLLMGSGAWKPNDDHLKMPLLNQRASEYRQQLAQAKAEGNPQQMKRYKKKLEACYSEIARRLSLGFAVFTFTLMGLAFGMHVSPRQVQNGIIWVIGLATLYLVCFFAAKGLHDRFYTAMTLYLLPHVIIITFCCRALTRISQGRTS